MKHMSVLRSMGFDYRYAARFMDDGGIYGRATAYPHRGGMVRRVFRTAIRIHFREPDYARNSANARAFNEQGMHVLFAYQMRPKRTLYVPPPAREPLPYPEAQFPVLKLVYGPRDADYKLAA